MFGLKRLLGGKANELKVVSKKIENRNLMEAIVGGQLLIAYSEDRNLDDGERAKIEGLLRTNPNLSSFGNELTDYFNQTNNALKAGYITARLRILREIEEIKSLMVMEALPTSGAAIFDADPNSMESKAMAAAAAAAT